MEAVVCDLGQMMDDLIDRESLFKHYYSALNVIFSCPGILYQEGW